MSNRLFGIKTALAEAKDKPLQNMTISTDLVVDMGERITALENTNRLLCRDLDEAQRAIEVLRGEGK